MSNFQFPSPPLAVEIEHRHFYESDRLIIRGKENKLDILFSIAIKEKLSVFDTLLSFIGKERYVPIDINENETTHTVFANINSLAKRTGITRQQIIKENQNHHLATAIQEQAQQRYRERTAGRIKEQVFPQLQSIKERAKRQLLIAEEVKSIYQGALVQELPAGKTLADREIAIQTVDFLKLEGKWYINLRQPLGKGSNKWFAKFFDVSTLKEVAIGITRGYQTKIMHLKEGRVLKKFKGDRGIVQIRTYTNLAGEQQAIALKFYNRGELHNRLEKPPPLSNRQKRQIAADLLAGLATIHRKGILHDDLKPQNILLHQKANGDYKAVITDFDLSDEGTFARSVKGSPIYFTLEKLDSEPGTTAEDVFTMGQILHELYFHRQHPLTQHIQYTKKYQNLNLHELAKCKEIAEKRFDDSIPKPNLSKGAKDTPERIIWDMLNPDSKTRITAAEVSKRFEALPS